LPHSRSRCPWFASTCNSGVLGAREGQHHELRAERGGEAGAALVLPRVARQLGREQVALLVPRADRGVRSPDRREVWAALFYSFLLTCSINSSHLNKHMFRDNSLEQKFMFSYVLNK